MSGFFLQIGKVHPGPGVWRLDDSSSQ